MKKRVFLGLIFFVASNVYAIPNVWERMLRQDTYSFNISDIKNNSLTINCATTFRNGYEEKTREVFVESNGKVISNTENKNPLSFFINDTESYSPLMRNTPSKNTDWQSFFTDLKSSTKIEIYNNNKLLFILNPRNSKKALTDISECLQTDIY